MVSTDWKYGSTSMQKRYIKILSLYFLPSTVELKLNLIHTDWACSHITVG